MPNYKYEINEVINNYKVLERKYINKTWTKRYLLKCLQCGYEFYTDEKRIKENHKCNCCLNRVCLKGFNDVGTTNPELVKYFKNMEDAYSHTIKSKFKAMFKCPVCGDEQNNTIYNFFKNGVHCGVCGDKGSYSERFVKSMLNQMNLYNETQKIFDWAKNKRYDFYIPSLSLIIETHGAQHYEECNITNNSLEEEQLNDKYKEEMALKHGIKYYVQLDCRKSTINYIKSSIENSILIKLLDLSDVDWNKCIYEYNKKFYDICKYYKENDTSARKMTDIFDVPRYIIVEYLKIGDKLGICKHDETQIEKTRKNFAKESIVKFHSNKKIICLNDNKIFNTYTDCAEYYNCNRISISKCCNKKNHYVINRNKEKLFFLFLEEYKKLDSSNVKLIKNFKQKYKTKETSLYNRKNIIDYSTLKIYESINDYMKINGINRYYFDKKIKNKEIGYYSRKEDD